MSHDDTPERGETFGDKVVRIFQGNIAGNVYISSSQGPGYVGAMGDNATGHLYLDRRDGGRDLRQLVAALRTCLEEHASQLDNPEQVADLIDDLEDKIDDGDAPEKIKRTTRLILRFAYRVQEFVDLVGEIHDLLDQGAT